MSPVPPLVLPATSVRPGPGPARSWLERELSRPEYRQSLADRFFSWLGDLWDSLQAAALQASPLSTGAAVLLAVAVAVLVVLVAGRVRGEPRGHLGTDAALGGGEVPPAQHRSLADAALARGDLDLAVVEGFRAVAARAVRRGLVESRPGRTARELAVELAPLLPDRSAALHAASSLFDSVFYGAQSATQAEATAVLELDDAVRLARPALAPDVQPGVSAQVPR